MQETLGQLWIAVISIELNDMRTVHILPMCGSKLVRC